MRTRVIWAFLMLLLWGGVAVAARAQADDPSGEDPVLPATEATQPQQVTEADLLEAAHPDSTAMVVVHGRELFEVGPLSVVTARERAAQISAEILELAKSPQMDPDDLRLVRDDRVKATAIVSGRNYVTAVWDYEAEVLKTTTAALAAERLDLIRQAVVDYRNDFSARALIRGGIIAAVVTILYIVVLRVIVVLRRRFEGSLDQRLGSRTLFKVLKGDVLVGVVRTTDRLVHFVVVLWLTLAYLNYLLSLFPWTYSIASQVFELAAGPLRVFARALVVQIPSLFFLAFIIVITIFTLRGIRFFFDEIEKGRISFGGFYADWARPTFNIVRVAVFAFALVVAFPYIPGSGSDAFKGVSLFFGVLVSLGSGSAMANAVSGIILIYMRPFAIGDRVRIGETVGDVVDRNLLTTRIRTTKNERVTIPNTNILSGQIINFTAKARTRELILHTSVTIGYDVPWRQVHELLLTAARATENVMADPEPFVLQKGLNDFYVEYELNAYTDQPRLIPATYSGLHQNIQDAFDAAQVEIMSPHARMVRDCPPKFGAETARESDKGTAGPS